MDGERGTDDPPASDERDQHDGAGDEQYGGGEDDEHREARATVIQGYGVLGTALWLAQVPRFSH
jgi:hypothetical protein